jgi:hypothetical protein
MESINVKIFNGNILSDGFDLLFIIMWFMGHLRVILGLNRMVEILGP